MKIIMTKGLPASGKTTWAKEQVSKSGGMIKRINKDDIRAMVDCGIWGHALEKHVLGVRDSILEYYLGKGLTVIIDDTNFSPKHEKSLKEIAEKYGAEFEVQDFTHISPYECIKRDMKRDKSVGRQVIMAMYRQYLYKPNPIEYKKELPDAIICDLDGTLAIIGDRNPYDASRCMEDYVNGPIVDIIESMNLKLILVSGRKDTYRPQTEQWLKEHKIVYEQLHMREGSDNRKDSIVKEEIYENFINGFYNIRFVLDDRNQVVEMWRGKGLTCLQVAEGDF